MDKVLDFSVFMGLIAGVAGCLMVAVNILLWARYHHTRAGFCDRITDACKGYTRVYRFGKWLVLAFVGLGWYFVYRS